MNDCSVDLQRENNWGWRFYRPLSLQEHGKGDIVIIFRVRNNQVLKTKDEARVKEQFLKVIHSLFLQVMVEFHSKLNLIDSSARSSNVAIANY